MTETVKLAILFSALLPLVGSAATAAQTTGELQETTLYYFGVQQRTYSGAPATWQHDASRSSINFETGKRGRLPQEETTDFDLTYGGTAIEKHGIQFLDWFRVTDPRSIVVDLGAKNWVDIKETPPFPRSKKPQPPRPLSNPPMVLENSVGRTDVSPYRQFVEVKPGHIYLIRLLHARKVIYTMFRVESLASQNNCVLSWKQVKPPTDDIEK